MDRNRHTELLAQPRAERKAVQPGQMRRLRSPLPVRAFIGPPTATPIARASSRSRERFDDRRVQRLAVAGLRRPRAPSRIAPSGVPSTTLVVVPPMLTPAIAPLISRSPRRRARWRAAARRTPRRAGSRAGGASTISARCGAPARRRDATRRIASAICARSTSRSSSIASPASATRAARPRSPPWPVTSTSRASLHSARNAARSSAARTHAPELSLKLLSSRPA